MGGTGFGKPESLPLAAALPRVVVVPLFIGPVLMRLGGRGDATAPC